ncbi:MAG: triose-phosphate isomerase [Anaerolineales bacterium]|nr:triose-phosphate isomerase [Anaerolineales bacterium]
MVKRKPIIAGNWKMNLGTVDEAVDLVRKLRPKIGSLKQVDVVLCPPYTVLAALAEILDRSRIMLGAQNMHWEPKGAHTGEISAGMLSGLCEYVIVGHSERRATGSVEETNAAVQKKLAAALEGGLTPILCVGESKSERDAGQTQSVIVEQVSVALGSLSAGDVQRCVLAYEPIWAIGTGAAASPVEANRVIALTIRGSIAKGWGEGLAQSVRVQYGGSVNPENIADFMAMPEIDGALVGGASLTPDFADLVLNAVGG